MKKLTGFTVIELLVVITVIAVLSTGGIVAFANFREERLALSDAQKIESELRSAQRRALGGDKPSGCGSISMSGYQVTLSGSSISTTAVCTGGTPASEVTNLDGTIATPATIVFKVLNGATDPATVQICSYNRLYSVSVSGVGAIQSPVKLSSC